MVTVDGKFLNGKTRFVFRGTVFFLTATTIQSKTDFMVEDLSTTELKKTRGRGQENVTLE